LATVTTTATVCLLSKLTGAELTMIIW
jgi:hypothetical protein